MPAFCLTWWEDVWAREEARRCLSHDDYSGSFSSKHPRSPGLSKEPDPFGPLKFCVQQRIFANIYRWPLIDQHLANKLFPLPRPCFFLLLPGLMVSSPVPELFSVESHSFPVWGALASDLQASSRPRSQQPQGLLLLIVFGKTMKMLCTPPSPHHCLENPAWRLEAIWPCSQTCWYVGSRALFLLSTNPSVPLSTGGNSQPQMLAASLTQSVLSSRWSGFTFRNGSASNSPFTVHVLIWRLCPFPCFLLIYWKLF